MPYLAFVRADLERAFAIAFFCEADSFWMLEFSTEAKDDAKYRVDILRWAQTAPFDAP